MKLKNRRKTTAEVTPVAKKQEYKKVTAEQNDYVKGISAQSAEVINPFALPETFGATEEIRLAQDSILTGMYSQYGSVLGHINSMGQFPVNQFIGYGALQNLSQNSMIRACINTTSDDCTREWIELIGGDTDEDGVKNEDERKRLRSVEDLLERKYKLRKLFNKALTTCGLMGGAMIFIDTGEEDTSLPLVISEKSSEFGKGKPVKFVLIDPINVSPKEYNAINPLREDYFQPHSYWVLGKEVHATRLIKIIENEVPVMLRPMYNFFGIAQSQLLMDYVAHFNVARVEACNLVKKLNFTVFKTNVQDALATPNGLSDIDYRVTTANRYRDNDSMFVCDKELEEIENITLTTTGVVDIVKQSLEMISAVNKTPSVKLLGISPTGFNSGETDLANYYDTIKSKQEKLLREPLNVVLSAIQLSEFGEIDPSLSFVFKELGSDDELVNAQTAGTKAQTLVTLAQNQVISAEEARLLVKNDPIFGMQNINDRDDNEQSEEFDDGGVGFLDQLNAFLGGDGGSEVEGNSSMIGSSRQRLNKVIPNSRLRPPSPTIYDKRDYSDRTQSGNF